MGWPEANAISTVWKVTGWRAFLLLSSVAFLAVWLLVDWRASSIQFQTWISKESPSESTVVTGLHHTETSGLLHVHCSSTPTERKRVQERGSEILHNYGDDELIERALDLQAEVSLNLQTDRAFDISDGRRVKLNPETRSGPKIAFLFLVVADIPLEPLWRKFFEGHEDLYNVYVHTNPSWLRVEGARQRLGMFWGRTVPSALTRRSDPNIVAAERRLLANALLDDPLNEWFVLVSESCIPLRNFSTMYRALNATSNSFIDCGKGAPGSMMMSRYLARGGTAMLPEVPFSEFRLGSQFFAIRRRHAVMVIRDKKYWSKFKLPCIRNSDTCYPDEHYVQTVIGNLDEPACKGTPTFLSWNGSKGGHPHRFGREEITPHLIEVMQATQNNRFLLARKFRWDALEPLLALSDLLFR